jgi:hypothetical protein
MIEEIGAPDGDRGSVERRVVGPHLPAVEADPAPAYEMQRVGPVTCAADGAAPTRANVVKQTKGVAETHAFSSISIPGSSGA